MVAFQITFHAEIHVNNFFYFLKIIFDISTSKRSKKYKSHLILVKKKELKFDQTQVKTHCRRSSHENAFSIALQASWGWWQRVSKWDFWRYILDSRARYVVEFLPQPDKTQKQSRTLLLTQAKIKEPIFISILVDLDRALQFIPS